MDPVKEMLIFVRFRYFNYNRIKKKNYKRKFLKYYLLYIKANFDGRIGAVGFVPLIVPRRFHPLAIIQVNNQTYEPVRDSNGLCIRAGTSENLTCDTLF